MGPAPKPTKPKTQVTTKLLSLADEPRRELRYAPVTKSEAAPSTNNVGKIVSANTVNGTDGIKGFVQHDERGLTWNSDHAFAPGKAPKMGPPVSAVGNIATAIVPLPEEPIGVHGVAGGARAEGPMGNAKLTGSTVSGSGEAKVNLQNLVHDWYKLSSTSVMQFDGKAPNMPPSKTETSLEGK